jgi:hypothetical protein
MIKIFLQYLQTGMLRLKEPSHLFKIDFDPPSRNVSGQHTKRRGDVAMKVSKEKKEGKLSHKL